jgi:hypothetical protein
MERHPSTSFIVTTNRHATEQAAMDRAHEMVQSKVDAYMITAPSTSIVQRTASVKQGYDSKYSASATVVVAYV